MRVPGRYEVRVALVLRRVCRVALALRRRGEHKTDRHRASRRTDRYQFRGALGCRQTRSFHAINKQHPSFNQRFSAALVQLALGYPARALSRKISRRGCQISAERFAFFPLSLQPAALPVALGSVGEAGRCVGRCVCGAWRRCRRCQSAALNPTAARRIGAPISSVSVQTRLKTWEHCLALARRRWR